MTLTYRIVAGLAALAAFVSPAAAHHIWIAPDAGGAAVVHFGEFAENLKEPSPGPLDRIELTARLISAKGEKKLEASRGTNGIVLSGSAVAGDSIIAEDTRSPVRERKSGEQVTRSVYHPAARLVTDLAAREPVLILDIVPTAQAGQFRVVFRGAPLAKTKVEIIAASGWVREVRTGEDGTFEAAFPWKSLYAIEVQHPDRTPGSRDGQAFDMTNFVTTLSYMQPTGLEPPPPPAPPKPNR
jgi:hypothetical protein